MKKSVLVLILATVLLAAGCANKNANAAQSVFPEHDISAKLDDYMTSVQEQSDTIQHFLEHDALTQADMNVKSQELYELWDEALNYLWNELKISLSEKEFAALQDEQCLWIAEKEKSMEEAGKEFEGGSIYPLVVNSEAARLTQERVYQLYELLK